MLRVALFVGEQGAHMNELTEYLKHNGYQCLTCTVGNPADEVDQLGQQAGMGILIFSDPDFACEFLTENSWPSFPRYNAVYLPKTNVLNLEVQDKLSGKDLCLFDSSNKDKLLKALNEFMLESKNTETDEIEISVHDTIKVENE